MENEDRLAEEAINERLFEDVKMLLNNLLAITIGACLIIKMAKDGPDSFLVAESDNSPPPTANTVHSALAEVGHLLPLTCVFLILAFTVVVRTCSSVGTPAFNKKALIMIKVAEQTLMVTLLVKIVLLTDVGYGSAAMVRSIGIGLVFYWLNGFISIFREVFRGAVARVRRD